MDYDYVGQYVVIDLEFSKVGNQTEVFEFAAKKIFTTLYGENIVEGDTFRRLIKPHNTPSTSLLNLTGISRQELEASLGFKEVFQEFLDWVGTMDTFYVSWGPRDSAVLRMDCKVNGFEKEFNEMSFIDLQAYIMELYQLKQLPSLLEIVEREFGEFEGKEHHADSDAYNTALLMKSTLQKMNKGGKNNEISNWR